MTASFFTKKRGHIINSGHPVWALDFLPQPPLRKSQTQYIVIAGHPSLDARHNLYTRESSPNVIQLWAVKPDTSAPEGSAYLATLICHSWGTCWGLRFCPYGAYGNGRLGLLAGAFGDGTVRVFDVRNDWIGNAEETVNVRVSEAAWEFSFGEFLGTCVAWKSHTEVVIGCSNGMSFRRETHVRICCNL